MYKKSAFCVTHAAEVKHQCLERQTSLKRVV